MKPLGFMARGESGVIRDLTVQLLEMGANVVVALIYIPCAATIGAIKRETNSWKWTAFAIGYSLVLGWLVAVIIYQVGRLLGLG